MFINVWQSGEVALGKLDAKRPLALGVGLEQLSVIFFSGVCKFI